MEGIRSEIYEILKKADLYRSVSRYDAAEKLLKTALTDFGPIANIYNALGVTYHNQSKFLDALNAFNLAVSANPEFVEGALNLAATLCDLSRYEDAQKVFSEVSKYINPKKKLPRLVLGRLANQHATNAKFYEESDLLPEAVIEYKKALSLYPDMLDVKIALTKCFVRLGQLDKARLECEEILQRNPEHGEANIWAGILHYKMSHKDLAKKYWEKACHANPEDPASRALLRLSQDWPSER